MDSSNTRIFGYPALLKIAPISVNINCRQCCKEWELDEMSDFKDAMSLDIRIYGTEVEIGGELFEPSRPPD